MVLGNIHDFKYITFFRIYLVACILLSALGEPVLAATQSLGESLTIERAIAKALDRNPVMLDRRLIFERSELDYASARDRLWLPQIALESTSRSTFTLTQLPDSTATSKTFGDPGWLRERGTPSSQVGVRLAEFTIYNSGRDKDAYEAAKLQYDRAETRLVEAKRRVIFQTIQSYYDLKTKQDLLEISRRSVEQAEAIFELVKSRLALGQAQASDISSAEVDLLNAKNIFISDRTRYQQGLWGLNRILGDSINTAYQLTSEVKFDKINISLSELIAHYKETSPDIRDAKLNYEQSKIQLRLAEKNRLPLPRVQFSGLFVGYEFAGLNSVKQRTTTLSDTSGNFNLQAQVTLTLPLYGPDGLFNAREIRRAEIDAERAEVELRNAANVTDVQVRSLFTQIVQLEESIRNYEKLFKEASVVFNASLSKLQTPSMTNRLDFKNSIEQIRSAEQSLTSSILEHIQLKLQLAETVGIDRLDRTSQEGFR